ncbi:MAG TPA: site-2 protease family protein [Myxococcales bacterium]|nr:site-2 protease family protein [Myxococcales bacterium]
MPSGSITLFRVRGIPIRAHWSLVLALAYITYAFSTDFEKAAHLAGVPRAGLTLPALLWGAVIAVALFVSVALHELAHSLFALRVGGRVREITLMIVGGVSQMSKMPPSLALEGWMALVGPLSSLVIALVTWLVRAVLPATSGLADLRLGLFYLAGLNLMLGLFNLLPAFPMDGGRVLRAFLGRKVGRARATQIAAMLGRGLSIALGLLGLATINVLLIIIAFFLYGGAKAEAGAEETHALLGGLKVRDMMLPHPLLVRTDDPLQQVGASMRDSGRLEAIVSAGVEGGPTGILVAQDLLRARTREAKVGDVGPIIFHRALQVSADEPAEAALTRAQQQGASYLVVVDESSPRALLGLVGPTEIQNALALRGLVSKQRAPDARTPVPHG